VITWLCKSLNHLTLSLSLYLSFAYWTHTHLHANWLSLFAIWLKLWLIGISLKIWGSPRFPGICTFLHLDCATFCIASQEVNRDLLLMYCKLLYCLDGYYVDDWISRLVIRWFHPHITCVGLCVCHTCKLQFVRTHQSRPVSSMPHCILWCTHTHTALYLYNRARRLSAVPLAAQCGRSAAFVWWSTSKASTAIHSTV